MEYTKIHDNIKQKIQDMLSALQIDQERKSLILAEQFGYLAYVRLFVESQKQKALRPYFPYAGFPMEWTRGEEPMEDQQRVWQLQYQVQYCSSIVEEGHFMEQAWTMENGKWLTELCKLIDWIASQCDWEDHAPEIFGRALEEVLVQIYGLGNSGILRTPDTLVELMIRLGESSAASSKANRDKVEDKIEKKTEKKIEEKLEKNPGKKLRVWNPACRTGEFVTAMHQAHPEWEISGNETKGTELVLARMLRFYYGIKESRFTGEDPLETIGDPFETAGDPKESRGAFDFIITNLPVGELKAELQERFPVVTRKIQLQYLQKMMDTLGQQGRAVAVVNEGTLFKFEAELKVRQRLMEEFKLLGVISLPAGAFQPYTVSKASILIFDRDSAASQPGPQNADPHPEKTEDSGKEEKDYIWFYELQNPGYTLDKKRDPAEGSQIPEVYEVWKNLGKMKAEWKIQLAAGEKRNQWDNPVPASWERQHFWFADKETIRRNEYNLTVGRYRPWREEKEEISRSPMELLRQMEELEKETLEQIRELMKMTENYG